MMEERHDYCIINPSIRLSFFRAAPINIPTVILYFKMSQLSGVIIEILLEHLNTIAEVLPLRRVSRDVKIKADRRICGLILALASSHHHDYMDDHEIVRPGEFVVYLSQDEREGGLYFDRVIQKVSAKEVIGDDNGWRIRC